ncbi:MAG: hypothetical protein IJ740_00190, partial [Ruminococcus sp.]|nr:hypothetical protein [Ruminococcus sp.]
MNAYSTALDSGWYVVTGNITIGSRIECTGNVHLILCDGTTLNAPKGIAVNEDSSLTIYGQSGGTGKLLIDDVDDYCAGIGSYYDSYMVTINGGIITVTGGDMDAGIGGSHSGSGYVTINGGTVTATGGMLGAGIGEGFTENYYSGGADIT